MIDETYENFFTEVLEQVTGKVYAGGLDAFYAVSTFEGLQGKPETGPQRYNPLNSVVPHGDSTNYNDLGNGVGVQDYKSFPNGVAGTIELLRGSPWVGVVAALRNLQPTEMVLAEFAHVYDGWRPNTTAETFPRNDDLGDYEMTDHGPVKDGNVKPDPTPPAPSPEQTCEVRVGDNLWNLAIHYYGNGEDYKLIAEANHIAGPEYVIYPHQVLVIPPKS